MMCVVIGGRRRIAFSESTGCQGESIYLAEHITLSSVLWDRKVSEPSEKPYADSRSYRAAQQ